MRWTIGQENVIRELRHLGAMAIRDEIEKRFGVSHTKHAIQVRASNLGISLKMRHQCPECGEFVESVNRLSGMCPRCSAYYRVQEEIAFSEAIERERMEHLNGPSLEEAKHEYHKLRQQNRRTCEKYGLDVKAMRKHFKAGRA
jgi:ribosomal protein L37AE/L43A